MENRIRELRRKRNITMKQLGEELGLAESTISQYETGKRSPDNETLLKLGDFFGVSVGYILGNNDDLLPPELYLFIGNRIIDAAQSQGISAKDALAKIGISGETANEMTDGKYPFTMSTLTQVARCFSKSVQYFLSQNKKAPTPVSESGQTVNVVKIAGRDGIFTEKRLTDEQVNALKTLIEQLPDADDDYL